MVKEGLRATRLIADGSKPPTSLTDTLRAVVISAKEGRNADFSGIGVVQSGGESDRKLRESVVPVFQSSMGSASVVSALPRGVESGTYLPPAADADGVALYRREVSKGASGKPADRAEGGSVKGSQFPEGGVPWAGSPPRPPGPPRDSRVASSPDPDDNRDEGPGDKARKDRAEMSRRVAAATSLGELHAIVGDALSHARQGSEVGSVLTNSRRLAQVLPENVASSAQTLALEGVKQGDKRGVEVFIALNLKTVLMAIAPFLTEDEGLNEDIFQAGVEKLLERLPDIHESEREISQHINKLIKYRSIKRAAGLPLWESSHSNAPEIVPLADVDESTLATNMIEDAIRTDIKNIVNNAFKQITTDRVYKTIVTIDNLVAESIGRRGYIQTEASLAELTKRLLKSSSFQNYGSNLSQVVAYRYEQLKARTADTPLSEIEMQFIIENLGGAQGIQRDEMIMRMLFGVFEDGFSDPLTQEETASMVGLDHERVRQIKARGTSRVKQFIARHLEK